MLRRVVGYERSLSTWKYMSSIGEPAPPLTVVQRLTLALILAISRYNTTTTLGYHARRTEVQL
jgi:hypothetical protein